jgi:hypothetical protein
LALAPEPLVASIATKRLGVTKLNVAVVMVGPVNPTFLVPNPTNGAEWNHCPEPQLMTPDGYWPFSGWSWPAMSLKSTVVSDAVVKLAVIVWPGPLPVLIVCC